MTPLSDWLTLPGLPATDPLGCLIGATSDMGPDCVKTRMLGFAGAAGWLMKPRLCSDRFH